MTLRMKLLSTGLLCLGLGTFWVNYQNYRSDQNYRQHTQKLKTQQNLEWVAELTEQRLAQLESSVSYLDKSTVESLKRLGARYFVYAYEVEGDWRLKWKILGPMDESQILEEVNELDFGQLSQRRRSWDKSESGDLIYISPVALAESHQLKEGFLVFGLQADFFSFLAKRDPDIFMATADRRPIFQELPDFVKNSELSFHEMSSTPVQKRGISSAHGERLSAFFSVKTQAWVLRAQNWEIPSFWASSQFTYFLASFLFSSGLFVMLLYGWPWARREAEGLPAHIEVSRSQQAEMGEDIDAPASPITENHLERVAEFSDFLESVLENEYDRLHLKGISLSTQVEDGIEVMISPKHMRDFLKRLIENSFKVLPKEEERKIQIQVVEQSDTYQLIYLDTRTQSLPSGEPSSLLLQTEGSLESIDGILAYGSWCFADQLHVAKKGFCLSIDLPKAESGYTAQAAVSKDQIEVAHEDTPSPTDEEVRLGEPKKESPQDIEQSLLTSIDNLEVQPFALKDLESSSQDETKVSSVQDIEVQSPDEETDLEFTNFELKDMNFAQLLEEESHQIPEPKPKPLTAMTAESGSDQDNLPQDDKGLFEFKTGDFKIKVRAPKKRGQDVNR